MGLKDDAMEKYATWKAEQELKQRMKKENDSNEDPKKKGGLGLMGLLALIYNIVMAVFFYIQFSAADDAGSEYLCRFGGENYATIWKSWMTLAFWSFLILAVLGILAIVGAAVPAARCAAGCFGCCGLTFNLVVVIAVTVVRFNEAGSFCAAPVAVANGT